MAPSQGRLPRTLSVPETWGFGFTVLLFWLVVAPEVHEALGPAALAVWLPAALVGVVINLQIRKLALARPDAAGGSPVFVADLWSDRPLIARWSGLAYFHSWAIVPPAVSWLIADLAAENLQALGYSVSATPILILLMGAIYLTAFSGIRVLSVVHLFFLLPSLGLLLLFGVQGLGWLLFSDASPGPLSTTLELPGWTAWLAGYFLVAYTTYGIDTAAAFSADSRSPRATIACLVAAAVLVLPIMVGGSWLLLELGPPAGGQLSVIGVLETAAAPFWGGFTPLGVTFTLAASMVLACATSVAVAPRVAWQLGQDGVLASTFGRLYGRRIPRNALLLATVVAVAHIWLDPVEMILLGGATWVGFWCLMHLGLWRRRREPQVLWPQLALGLGILEATVLVLGGWAAGSWWIPAGLLVPVALMGVDQAVRWRLDPRTSERPEAKERAVGSQAWEIVLMVALILMTLLAGWTVGRLVGLELTPAAIRLTVIVLLVSAFVGAAWASWTSLRKLELLERDIQEREASEWALRASEARLDLALEAGRAGVWDLDVTSGTVTRAGQWEAFLNRPLADLEGSLAGWEALLHPDDREPVLERLRTHLNRQSPIFESEHRLRTGSDDWVWVLERGHVVESDEAGQPVRMLGTTADLTDRKRLEHQFAQAQKMEAVGRLAGGVAHDFNNVLTAILGTADLLLSDEGEELDEQHRADLQEIRDAARRAADITHQLLAFSRRQQLRPRLVDVNHAVEKTTRLLNRLIQPTVQLETRCQTGLTPVRADPTQLEQAIVNLALNARDAMPGGGTLVISTRPYPISEELAEDVEGVSPGPGIAVSVADQGGGITPEVRTRLFEPFFTTKEIGKGTGLGLAMVYGFVRQSGGLVLVDTELGEGTTISLVFPEAGRSGPADAPGADRPGQEGRS